MSMIGTQLIAEKIAVLPQGLIGNDQFQFVR